MQYSYGEWRGQGFGKGKETYSSWNYSARDLRCEGPISLATNALNGTCTPEFCLETDIFSVMRYWLGKARTQTDRSWETAWSSAGKISIYSLRSKTPEAKNEEMGILQRLRTASKSAALRAKGREASVWVQRIGGPPQGDVPNNPATSSWLRHPESAIP